MRKAVSIFAVMVLLAFSMTACTDPYGVAAKLAQDVAVSVNQANVSIDQLRVQGTISADEERNILSYLSSLNTLDGQYISCVQVAHGQSFAGGFTKCAQSLAAGIGHPETLEALHVSNPASQQKVVAVAQGIAALVTATITALGGK